MRVFDLRGENGELVMEYRDATPKQSNRLTRAYPLVMALICSTTVGCGPDQATRLGGDSEVSRRRTDNVAPQLLRAGFSGMQRRVLRTVEAYSKIQPTAQFRYFMHPTMEKDAVIEFNVSGLAEVTLSPRISDLDPTCFSDPEAATVAMSYALDANAPTRVIVDRKYDHLIPIVLRGARSLTVSVNQGNGVITCDWFGLGVIDVK